MSWGDVRGLLQYVPQFSGKVFLIVVDAPVSALAETMLDLVTLQNIGVKLIIASTQHSTDDLLDRAAEVEMKFSQGVHPMLPGHPETSAALDRGQAVIIDLSAQSPMKEDLVNFAISLSAAKLILLHGEGESFPRGAIRAAEVTTTTHPSILSSAASACEAGIPRVHVLDGTIPGVLLRELFSNEGVGTMVYADSYRVIRPLREDDIVELLGMISRSVRSSHLVPRNYSHIEKNITDYSVMEIDGNVVGSVALHRYEGDATTAEVACLYVKQSHESLGYGVELVHHAEDRAREMGLASVFALTNRAAAFFKNKLNYTEWSAEDIPPLRRDQLLASGRNSRIFGKKIS